MRLVALTALYFLGGVLGKKASLHTGNAALVWPSAGIALAAILLYGYRFWPGIALGAVLFSIISGQPFGYFTLGTAAGNTVGAVLCAFLLKRFVNFDNAMLRTRDATGFILLACGLGTTVNALFNVVGLIYAKKNHRGRAVFKLSGLVGAQCAGDAGGNAGYHHLERAGNQALEFLACD